MCSQHIGMGARILEIGAGPPNLTSEYLASIGEVHGIDIDPDVATNQALQTSTVLKENIYPFENESFDACVSNYVLEHVSDPRAHFGQVKRVLRPGGTYLFRTPNIFHYVAMVSRFTPHSFHKLVANRLRDLPREAHDPYPTVYKANSRRSIAALAAEVGLEIVDLRMVEKEPLYGLSNRVLFMCFLVYERLVNRSEVFAPLRANIFGVLKRPL
jgi:2-polyprenyl-3-methyl-5-hydroxy-6-metoxy-1,4-benzoquinol methylase